MENELKKPRMIKQYLDFFYGDIYSFKEFKEKILEIVRKKYVEFKEESLDDEICLEHYTDGDVNVAVYYKRLETEKEAEERYNQYLNDQKRRESYRLQQYLELKKEFGDMVEL